MTDEEPVISIATYLTQDGSVEFRINAPESEDDVPDGIDYANGSLAVASMLRVVARKIEDQSVGMIET